jgi:hypothetical protein
MLSFAPLSGLPLSDVPREPFAVSFSGSSRFEPIAVSPYGELITRPRVRLVYAVEVNAFRLAPR